MNEQNNTNTEPTVTVTTKPVKVKKVSKKKTNINKGANKIKAASKAKNVAATVQGVIAKLRGRPVNSFSCLSVPASTLLKLVEAGLEIPVSYRFCKMLNIQGTPFQSTATNLKNITQAYSTKTGNGSVSVINLNETQEVQELAAAV